MTTNHKDAGGPAFPVECFYPADGTGPKGTQTSGYTGWEMGMTLRDYFAAKAMAAYATHISANGTSVISRSYPEIAQQAYEIADAMRNARGEA